MDPITQQVVLATAGAAGAADATYVDDVFSTYLFDGTGSTQTITNGIDLSGEGGLVWIKRRSAADPHQIYDTERGANKLLRISTGEEVTSFSDLLTSFNSNGFSLGADSGGFGTNPSSSEMVSWSFRKAPGFFDVVTYTGNGTSGRTISHNLGSVPGMIIVKSSSSGGYNWAVWHRNLTSGKVLSLNLDNAEITQSYFPSDPTATNFTVGSSGHVNSQYGFSYVAYIFAHDDQSFGTDSDEAIIKCGSFTVTGDASTGDFIDVGFEPQFVLTKTKNISNDWVLGDVMRGAATTEFKYLLANSSSAEGTLSSDNFYATSTGFRYRAIGGSVGDEVIYMAIRRPHKPPEAATDVFALDATSASGNTGSAFDAPFPVDMYLLQKWGSGDNKYIATRLATHRLMYTNATNAESYSGNVEFDYMDGVVDAFDDTSYSAQMFKRAPGFFDVVAYEGTGSARTLDHNLEAVPELVIVKNRENASYTWAVYTEALGRNKVLYLNEDEAASTFNAPSFWGSTDFTATQISLGSYANTNHNGVGMIAYLFASLSGISKIGTYSGTGSNIDVDCGFTAGARFVLIKRTDGSNGQHVGDWYMWDTAHGIVSGNDPYIRLNDANQQVTGTDYIDPLNAGFTVTSSAPAALNTSGGTYLFLAIA